MQLKSQTFTARLRDGTTVQVKGIALRVTIEGKHRHFVVHSSATNPDQFFTVVSEVSTGLRLTCLPRYVREPRAAKRLALQTVREMLDQGLGPKINSQIEKRKVQ